ncbi:MAG: 4-hydroxy-3-methylbut-2-enyl diphosphate reductase [Candidatus Omnitrophota bacterium]|nr:MAG: 4-hydroxy-3-methylbut-2-enyl diphosphate reductase [Candidatus Omnitrophota bacterium]
MKVYKAKNLGFCFGVKRAIEIARDSLSKFKKTHPSLEKSKEVNLDEKIYIIGDLVHNERVSEEIQRMGIKKVKNIDSIPSGTTLLIKAHGVPQKLYSEAKKRNINIIDATCPKVAQIHKKAKNLEEKGYQIIIVGDKNHEETIGILGNTKKGIVVEKETDLKKIKHKIKKKVAVVVQSTQNIDDVAKIIYRLSKIAKELFFINTICEETEKRQKEVKELAKKCEAILVIGSKKSANTTRLYRISKKINDNTFFVTKPELPQNIKRFKTVGIIGGASTPLSLLEEVYKKLK